MTKLPARGPMPSMLLALLSLGIMPVPTLRVARWEDGQHGSV
jgi:hypothetical protein